MLYTKAKMNYLKGILTDDAARAIAGFPITSQNYGKSIQLLKERFERKQTLINAHMESLSKSLSKIDNPSTDTQQLRKFYEKCETNICVLETLGIQTDSYGSLLIPIILKKLPEELRYTIFRANSSTFSSLNDLRTALQKELETKENSKLIQ